MRSPRRVVALAALVVAGAVAAGGCGASTTPTLPSAPSPSITVPASEPATWSPTPLPSTVAPSPSATPVSTSSPPAASAVPTPRPTATPTPTAVATPAGLTVERFWALVERGVSGARRVEVEIAGPNAGTLRFETAASATVIEGVVGFVCVDGRAYDGQSGFSTLPGRWTCGSKALTAGFRSIGQPIDAWNATLPTDRNRRESVVDDGATWTWRYTATSPYLGGEVTASVTLNTATGRITSARRGDPTGVTRYTFRYGADFPAIAVPR